MPIKRKRIIISSGMRQTNTSPLPTRQPRRQQPEPKTSHKKLWLILVVALVMLLGSRVFHPQKSAAEVQTPKVTRSTAQQQADMAAMSTAVNTVLSNNPTVDISATVIDVNSGKTQNYGPDVAYEAASVAKLVTASELLHAVESGKERLSTKLDDGNSASVDLQKMVVKSDNAAWQSLTDKMGLTALQAYAQSIGITDYNLANNSLTTKDIALLLQKLYAGKLLNKAHTTTLLNYMAKANEADLIPPVIPNGVSVYHKAGLLDDRVHDAAIIDNGTSPIIVVVFTNGHGTYSFPARTEAIQTITKAALRGYDIR